MRSLSHKTAGTGAGPSRTAFYLDETPKHAFSTVKICKKKCAHSRTKSPPRNAVKKAEFWPNLKKETTPPRASQPGSGGWGVVVVAGGGWWVRHLVSTNTNTNTNIDTNTI